jgi:hypothetical protein
MLERNDVARVLAIYHRLLPKPECRLTDGELCLKISKASSAH